MDIFIEWRRWIRPLIIAFYIVALVVIIPLIVVEFQLNRVLAHLQAWYIGGIFVLLAMPISLWGVVQHLIHYTQPRLQRYIIRILWMVPIYASDAWLALRFKEAAIYLDTIRECYEAYVLYNFMAYLLQFLTTEYVDLDSVLEAKEDVSHLFPFCLLPKWKNGRQVIMRCKHGVLQYTVVRPITTVIALITQFANVYHEGKFQPRSAWLYLTIINSFSQGLAMYSLVMFYKATKEELRHLKPIPKFLCIKAIVFFLFWQQVFIAGLVAVGVITKDNTNMPGISVQNIATGLQDFIICIEMLLFAIAHYYSFSHKPYVDYALGHQNCCISFREMWDVSDVRDDVVDHVRTVGVTASAVVTRPLRKKPPGSDTEKTPLLKEGPPSSPESGAAGGVNINEPAVLTLQCNIDDSNRMPVSTPPVHIEVGDYYEIQTNEAIQQQQWLDNCDGRNSAFNGVYNIGSDVNNSNNDSLHKPNLLGDEPLIDFVSNVAPGNSNSSSDRLNTDNKSSLKLPKQHNNSHTTQQQSPHQQHSLFDEIGESSKNEHNATTVANKYIPQTSMDDSVSTHTFESVSDITDTSINKPSLTGSMHNYAQFSDTDTVSHTSQQSEVQS